MTGGMAYLYDPEHQAKKMLNMDTLVTCSITVSAWEDQLKRLVEKHAVETGSLRAEGILQRWETELPNFLQICPKEMLMHLPHPLITELESMPAE